MTRVLMPVLLMLPLAAAPLPADTRDEVAEAYERIQAGARAGLDAQRPIMANPYEEIHALQTAQRDAEWVNAARIRALSELSSQRVDNPREIIRARMGQLSGEALQVDAASAIELLNLDAAPVEVERVPVATRRDVLVPTIGMVEEGATEIASREVSYLEGWELVRADGGVALVGRIGDPRSRIPVRLGMILGEAGRISALRDTPDAFYLVLENGVRIGGEPKAASPEQDDLASEVEDIPEIDGASPE